MVPLTKPQLTKQNEALLDEIAAVRKENARISVELEELRWKLRKALVDLALAEKVPYGVHSK